MIFHLVVEREEHEGPHNGPGGPDTPMFKIASLNVGRRDDTDARPTHEELEGLAVRVADDRQHNLQGYVFARHFDAMLKIRRRWMEVMEWL